MRISTGMTKNKIRAKIIIIAMFAAILVMPVTLMAYENYMTPEALEMLRTGNTYMIVFDPAPGSFTASETASGVRIQPDGQPLPRHRFPHPPILEDYVFDGWRLSDGTRVDGDYLVLTVNITNVEAIWIRYGEEPSYTPATPTPSPATTATPTPSPATTATPSPTPPPSQSAGSPNPPTNPITISLMIFGAVATLGIAAFGIIGLSMRHTVAVGKYRTSAMRYKRESRLAAILGVKNTKSSK